MTEVLRRFFASTGAPPAWALVRYLTVGLLAGGALTAIGSILLAGAPTGDIAGRAVPAT
jgi:hypothetical protein